jgi:hypothetical protein
VAISNNIIVGIVVTIKENTSGGVTKADIKLKNI